MENNSVFQNVLRRWWIVLTVLLLTLGAAIYLSQRQRPVFEASSTFITKPSDLVAEDRNLTSILSMMNRDNEIITTIAEVAKSGQIRIQAASKVGINGEDLGLMTVRSRVIAGTNILRIAVTGPDPSLAQKLTTSIGEETIAYANSIYPAYQLRVLDPATLPETSAESTLTMNLIMGSLIGLLFGIAAALLASWASSSRGGAAANEDRTPKNEDQTANNEVRSEMETLRNQFIALRRDLYDTRTTLKMTEQEARAISTSLKEIASQLNGRPRS